MEALPIHVSNRITPSIHKRCLIVISQKDSHYQHVGYIFVPSVVGLVGLSLRKAMISSATKGKYYKDRHHLNKILTS